jgi:hypothetical protein
MNEKIREYNTLLDQRRMLQRQLSTLSYRLSKLSLELSKVHSDLEPGNIVRSNKSGRLYEIDRLVFTRSGEVILDCIPVEPNGHHYTFTSANVTKI